MEVFTSEMKWKSLKSLNKSNGLQHFLRSVEDLTRSHLIVMPLGMILLVMAGFLKQTYPPILLTGS